MMDINWLHFIILIFAVFSINYLIVNEVTVYFSGKSYLTKWVICFIVSTIIILLKSYIPSSFIYVLALAVAGGVEFLNGIISFVKKRKALNYEKKEEYKKIPDINELIKYYQNQISTLRNRKNEIIGNYKNNKQPSTADSIKGNMIGGNPSKNNQAIVADNINHKADKTNSRPSSKINISAKDIKIIDSDRMYGQQEFLKETQDQEITLSPYLQSNLNSSNLVKK